MSMSSRPAFAIIGLFVGAAVDLLVNLLAAAIQKRVWADQFSVSSIAWLAGLAIAGLLVGHWLGGQVQLPPPPAHPQTRGSAQTVTITRVRALLSYGKLRGTGIHLSDILLFGSRLDIDTKGDIHDRHSTD